MTSATKTTRFAKAAALVGAGALGATILTGVAFAADPTPNPSASSTTGSDDGMGGREGRGDRGGPGGHRGGGMMGFGGEVLHGDATVETTEGTTQTVRVVRGEVTAISDTAITVRATDGFEQTFVINAETDVHKSRDDAAATDIAVGDQAMVQGVVAGDTVTAERIGAMTAAEAAEMDANMAERRAEMEQRMAERQAQENADASAAPTTAS